MIEFFKGLFSESPTASNMRFIIILFAMNAVALSWTKNYYVGIAFAGIAITGKAWQKSIEIKEK